MKKKPANEVSRRRLLGAAIGAAGATATIALLRPPAMARSFPSRDKRRSRYQADSAEVRNFYRVNRYPPR